MSQPATYWEIVLPGMLVGVICGVICQRWRVAASRCAASWLFQVWLEHLKRPHPD
jgi:uncharacterized membrane-anchored protein YhcB (DUF1043 family)